MTGHTNFFESLGWAVLNSLWQMAFLWVVYQIITALFKNATSSSKSSLASVLLITGFAWFIYTFFSVFASSSTDGAAISSELFNTESSYPVNDWLQQILPVASGLYLVLLLIPIMRFIRNYRYVKVIRHYGLTKINADWRIFVTSVANRMGIKKQVRIWISELVSSPVTIGFIKPVILVPLAAINHLTPQQLEAVLLHELSHIKRYDYLINLVINLIRTILYFNPFVKAFVKTVEQERENACDDMVLQFQYDSHDYATALLMLEKTNHLHKALIVGAVGNKNDLLHRVELIMGVNKKPGFSFNKLAGLLAGLFCIIGLNVLLSLNEQKNVSYTATSFAQLSTLLPYAAVVEAGKDNQSKEADQAMNEQLVRIQNSVAQLNPEKIADAINSNIQPDPEDMAAFANFELPVETPELKKYQEKLVKEALEASKKVLTSQQWKDVEKNIAEVFTQKEKEELKSTYQKEINKFDWKQWENKLQMAYDKIDWEKVNNQLSVAVNQIRMDSLQVVYNKALSKLDMVQEELNANNITSIPDTDITLKKVEQRKNEAQRVLNNLKAIRSKKIVHL
jgi:beta-lactamase regulating signal transducer with metallopeptidase domain